MSKLSASKTNSRRHADWRFQERWFRGNCLDIASGELTLKVEQWPHLESVQKYSDLPTAGDPQYLVGVQENSYDIVHSAHSLEVLAYARGALSNWLKAVKPGGYLVCLVYDELLYEGGIWPSTHNPAHRSSFTIRDGSIIPQSQSLQLLIPKLRADLEHLTLLSDGWDPKQVKGDQTELGAECSIEFVLKKPGKYYF